MRLAAKALLLALLVLALHAQTNSATVYTY